MVLQMEPKSARIWSFSETDARIEINYEQNQVVTAVKSTILLIQNCFRLIHFTFTFNTIYITIAIFS
jgi:hypothetical protein